MTLIRSYARIKPKAADKEGGRDSDKRITGWDAEAGIVEMNGKKYDHVHATLPPDVTQQRVYEVVAQPLVGKWLDGYDVDVLSYGQTGSGKTYTLSGPTGDVGKWMDCSAQTLPESAGIQPRSIHELFRIAKRDEQKYKMTCDCYLLELYRDGLHDTG